MIPSFPVKMEDQGSDAEEHMGETVCICGKVRTHLLPHLESVFEIFRRYLLPLKVLSSEMDPVEIRLIR
jgi:hypothetical protein